MKVGLLQRPGARYGRYWQAFLEELGLEVLAPQYSPAELYRAGRDTLPDAPASAQLALGHILAQPQLEALLLLESPAVPQDTWGQSLEELLPRRVSGLPPLIPIPDGGDLSAAATEIGQRLTHNPALVRLALDKVRPLSQPKRAEMPILSRAGMQTLALIGLPSLLEDDFFMAELRAKLEELGLFAVYASQLPPEQAQQRGARGQDAMGRPLEGAERELYGAQSVLEGKSAVRGLLYLAAARDAATQEALARLQSKAHKPSALLILDPDAPDFSALGDLAKQLPQS